MRGLTCSCVLFGHEIRDIEWFNPHGRGGSLGHVSHSYDLNSYYQTIGNFFIGIAPILGGTVVIYLSSRLLLGSDLFTAMSNVRIDSASFGSFESVEATMRSAVDGFRTVSLDLFRPERILTWKFLLFLYLTFSVGSSIRLSRADVEGAAFGFGVLVFLLLVFNLATLWLGESITGLLVDLAGSYSVFLSVMLFAILLNGVAAVLLLGLPQCLRIMMTGLSLRVPRLTASRGDLKPLCWEER